MGLLGRNPAQPAGLFLGLDPGSSGGYAVLDFSGKVLEVSKWKETLPDTCEALRAWRLRADNLKAFLENVGPTRQFGREVKVCPLCKRGAEQGVSSAFTFGDSFGSLKGLLVALGIPYEKVASQTWQKPFRLPTLKEAGTSTAKKNAHKARAQELWPDVRFTHATADACLIAEYGRRNGK